MSTCGQILMAIVRYSRAFRRTRAVVGMLAVSSRTGARLSRALVTDGGDPAEGWREIRRSERCSEIDTRQPDARRSGRSGPRSLTGCRLRRSLMHDMRVIFIRILAG
jgi:hypothetical protein